MPGIEFKRDGTVNVGPDMMTGAPGVFAGGDMVPSERTVTVAVGHGKLAARNIDAWLRGSEYRHPPVPPVVDYGMLQLPMFSDADPTAQRELPLAGRTEGFAEVLSGLTEREARREAQRCLSCGNCFECDNCFAACPEEAIIKLGPGNRYQYDYAKCTGCAVCFEQCPCHAIEMIPEPATV
jgi:Pyruvate/2-oxoacid:ferredoxin oxidoreductase delta subunit